MAKPGPKASVPDSVIVARIGAGGTDAAIARSCHTSRARVSKLRNGFNRITPLESPETIRALKEVVKLELNQEETRSEFSDQLHEYTQNYKTAMEQTNENGVVTPDFDAAAKWAMLRLRLLENMVKISGLDQLPLAPKDQELKITIERV